MNKTYQFFLITGLSVFGQMLFSGPMLFSNDGELAFQYIRENKIEELAKMLKRVLEQDVIHSEFEEKDLPPLTVAEIDGKHFMDNITLRKLIYSDTDRQRKPTVKKALDQAIDVFLMRLYLKSQKDFSYNYTEIAQKLAAKLKKFLSVVPETSYKLSQILRVNLKECKDAYAKDKFLKLPDAKKILEDLRIQHAVKTYPKRLAGI